MKIFKKNLLLVLSILFLFIHSFFMFPMVVHAAEEAEKTDEIEEISPMQNEDIPVFAGLDATVRDCNELNIREAPTTSSNIISTIPYGEDFKVLTQTGKWFQIEYQDISGFVFWKYVSFIEPEITEDSNLIGNSIIHYTSSENRDINMSIACSTINGTILNPNEEFRWSNIVGQTTAEKGYLSAPVIINKKSVLGLGGGVCQVSTTLYNALLDTSIVPTELHHHSLQSSYVKPGYDATVAHGFKDFAFTNTYEFPIQIEAYAFNAIVFVNLYKVEN